jgi:alpha-glucan,water dikinase
MTTTERMLTGSGIVLSVEKNVADDTAEVTIRTEDQRNCLLHWGVRQQRYTPWQIPPEGIWPEGSYTFDHAALRTPFRRENGRGWITIRIDRSMDLRLIDFVIYFPDEDNWDNNHGRNYRIEVPAIGKSAPFEASLGDKELAGLAEEIIEKEMSRNSWTLMHRFNLCYDLLDRIRGNDTNGLALIFVWLRFSYLRQLDWQRNYNTKPRELGHALDRLTLKLADRYVREPGDREMIRLIMTTLGRGTDAQRVRDEVLNIMHRHHIKEVSGHFMEEWHQKLHNNATPDDIVICEAYLEFLRSNGNLAAFYKRLEEGGVGKERLEGYERPIRSHPDFIPHLKEALIRDFEHFLGILKEVHSATDLGTSIHLARHLFDAELHSLMDFIWFHHDDGKIPVGAMVEKITYARRRIMNQFHGRPERVRDFLFLDLALEDFLRLLVERSLGAKPDSNQLVDLEAMVLENLCMSGADTEFTYCLRHWERLGKMPRFDREWSLHAKAVIDRMVRAMGDFIDRYYRLLQPKAEFLGNSFHAANWTITLFSEEVVRGRTAFVLALLLRTLEPLLRKSAALGSWQIISSRMVTGTVEQVESLKSIQTKNYSNPVVIVAGTVAGDEEIPKGVSAIITPAVVDILSHLAVRARNAGLLFATCHDPEPLQRLKSLSGHRLRLSVNSKGDVVFEEGREEVEVPTPHLLPRAGLSRPEFTAYAIPSKEFTGRNVGGKANNLRRLKGNLPEWIGLPVSVALPFGVFEKVLEEESNREIAGRCEELVRGLEGKPDEGTGEALGELRAAILKLNAPRDLGSSLRTVMENSGLPFPKNWDAAWRCIKAVWASKWNERAYLSRRANAIPHRDLFMAVLIQMVVEADYGFVIHTVNPFTGARDEIYAEAVPGLGETLVGNCPGRALSFTCKKGLESPRLLSFPSKSLGLFGSGLIFRSDSNGEDLAGYAGAGLYDSVMLQPAKRIPLDYTGDALLWDDSFRREFMAAVAEIGTEVEKALGPPQDIEGAYSKERFYVVQSRPQVGIENV